jgi:hypothetical protein
VELLEWLARLEAALAERDARIEVLTARVAQLKALLCKDSRTSSQPPSSDRPGKPPPRSRRQPSNRPPGKQPGEPGQFTAVVMQRMLAGLAARRHIVVAGPVGAGVQASLYARRC